MSYNNQGYGQYPQQPQYGGGYDSNYNDPNAYPQQPQYGQQQGGYGSQPMPQRQDSYGPPQQGGFQHGQQGGQYGAYDASNPQGHAGYYGGYPEPQQRQQEYGSQYGGQNDAFAANQAYQQQMASGQGPDPAVANHQFQPQSTDPNAPNYDPNVSCHPFPWNGSYTDRYQAPPMTEQDRGLLGALGGGFAGHHFGKKADHGILGTIGGAILGSFAEDMMKSKKKDKYSSSNSSWGGGSKW